MINSSIKVLVVEDEKPLREALAKKLTQEGFAVFTASDGEEGFAKALTEKPNVILLDLVMPGTSGLSLFERLRSDAWGAQVPVIILTNLSADSPELVKAVVEGAPAYYLVKSDWALADIFQKVREIA